jgi:hypothetical protein
MQAESILINQKAAEQSRLIDELKQQQKEREMRKQLLVLVILIIGALLLVGSVSAQDTPLASNTPATTDPTPVATAIVSINGGEPVSAPIVVNTQPAADQESRSEERRIYVIGYLVLAVVAGIYAFSQNRQANVLSRTVGALVTTVDKALENKQVLDVAHQEYMKTSLGTQEFVSLAGGIASFIGAQNYPLIDSFADKVAAAIAKIKEPDEPPVNTEDLQRVVRSAAGGAGAKPLPPEPPPGPDDSEQFGLHG